jgi:peptide/nickel transport system ATP-binding protein
VVRALCDRIGVMRSGELVETAGSAVLFENPRHPYTHKLLRAIPLPERDPGWILQSPFEDDEAGDAD